MSDAGVGRDAKKRATGIRLRLVALDLFESEGFGSVSSARIADAAGVSARTFFNYFPTKDALLNVAGGRFEAEIQASVAACRTDLTTATLSQVVVDAVVAAVGADDEAVGIAVRALRLIDADDALRATSGQMIVDWTAVIVSIVREVAGLDDSLELQASVAGLVARVVAGLSRWASIGGTDLGSTLRVAVDAELPTR